MQQLCWDPGSNHGDGPCWPPRSRVWDGVAFHNGGFSCVEMKMGRMKMKEGSMRSEKTLLCKLLDAKTRQMGTYMQRRAYDADQAL